MTNKTRFTLSIALGFLGVFTINSSTDAATAHTDRGPRDGRVIVRRFDRIVVTILAENQQIFQFPGVSVEKITSDKNDLLSQDIVLRKEASDTAELALEAPLSRGLQVLILEEPENSEWVRVRGWGTNEGWIPKSILSNEVAIMPDEPIPAPIQPAAEVQEATTPPATEPAAPIDSATTPLVTEPAAPIDSATTPPTADPSTQVDSATTPVPSDVIQSATLEASESIESATPEATETVESATEAPIPDSQSAIDTVQPAIPSQEVSGDIESATTPPLIDGESQVLEAAPQPAETVESATPEQQAAPDTSPESATAEVESASGN